MPTTAFRPRPLRSILFVCLGNICRSPAAEYVMRARLVAAGLGDVVRCDSAGTSREHAGDPPDRRMRLAALRRGLELGGTARQVRAHDLDDFDLVLAMDEANHAALLRLSSADNRHKLGRFCSFLTRHPDREVPDPWYGGAAGFDYVLDLLEEGCETLLAHIRTTRQTDAGATCGPT
jgi:protein-tyrosine phosphatase